MFRKKDGSQKTSNVVEFIAANEEHFIAFDPPTPAYKLIPEWYKKMQTNLFDPENMVLDNNTGNAARSIKACMPVFDIISAGYIVTLPADIYVAEPGLTGEMNASWSTDTLKPLDFHHTDQFSEYPVSDEHYKLAVKFNNPWIIKTPPGYSTLFIQPSLREDLPFTVVPAIVDTDKHPSSINFPTFFKKDFRGILPYGMPVIQAIPFKREDWTHVAKFYSNGESEKEWQMAKRKILGRYKHFYRSIKSWK